MRGDDRCTEYAECEFPAELEFVADAAAKLRHYCARHGMDERLQGELELAAVEALNNAVVHGSQSADDTVRLRWSWIGDIFEMQVFDSGSFMPPEKPADLPEDLLAESGRGAFLLQTLTDSTKHRIVDGKHCLILRKRVGEKGSSHDREGAEVLEAMTAELSTSYENLAALFRFSEQLATAGSFDDFVSQIFDQVLELVAADEAHLRLADADGTLSLACSRGKVEPVPDVLGRNADTIETQVLRARQESTVASCASLPDAEPLRRTSGSAFVGPVKFRGTVLGTVAVLRHAASPFFTAGQISLMRVVTDYLGIARTAASLNEQRQAHQRAMRELEIAAEIQQSLLPKSFPNTPKSRVFGISQTAHEVGGDYFDALPIGDSGALLAIADVMGKGMPAALLATIFRTHIHARLDLAHDPGRLLTEVNRQISADLARVDMFITAQLAFLAQPSNELVFATAGHGPILRYERRAKEAVRLSAGGMPLGVMGDTVYASERTAARSGDRFLFLTDGVFEVLSPAGEMLGIDRVANTIPTLWTRAAPDYCGRLLDHVRAWSGGAPAADDRTLLILECL